MRLPVLVPKIDTHGHVYISNDSKDVGNIGGDPRGEVVWSEIALMFSMPGS